MKEEEIVITESELHQKWYDDAFYSIEAVKHTIESLSKIYQMDFYNSNEEMSLDKIKQKQAIKESNIVLPLTYDIEKAIKSLVLAYSNIENPQRESYVRQILNDVKNNYSTRRGNLHDTAMYIDYLNSVDNTFIDVLAQLYMSRREGFGFLKSRSNPYTMRMEKNERIDYARDMYKNAFIDYRYQFEKQDSENSIDLVKLMDYTESIRDAVLFFLTKKHTMDFIKEEIKDEDIYNYIRGQCDFRIKQQNRPYTDIKSLLDKMKYGINDYFDLVLTCKKYKRIDEINTSNKSCIRAEVEFRRAEEIKQLKIFERLDNQPNIILKNEIIREDIEDILEKALIKADEIYVYEYIKNRVAISEQEVIDFIIERNKNKDDKLLYEKVNQLKESFRNHKLMPIALFNEGEVRAVGCISKNEGEARVVHFSTKDADNKSEWESLLAQYIIDNEQEINSYFETNIQAKDNKESEERV